jgi:hypothetical protein
MTKNTKNPPSIMLKRKSKEATARASFLASLIKDSEEARLIDVGRSDFNIYFSKDLKYSTSPKEMFIEVLNISDEYSDTQRTIFDVEDDFFTAKSKDSLDSYLTLCSICSNFVTCSSEELQEQIYTNTGRLAYILEKGTKQGTTNKKNSLKDLFKLIEEDTFLNSFDKNLEFSALVLKDTAI